jgi:hypothetical protein
MWDKRTRRYAILEKKIIFEKNKKNGSVLVLQAMQNILDRMEKDIQRWNELNGVYPDDALWRPEVKVLDEITTRSKIVEIVGNQGELISFGHLEFEMRFGVKLP